MKYVMLLMLGWWAGYINCGWEEITGDRFRWPSFFMAGTTIGFIAAAAFVGLVHLWHS